MMDPTPPNPILVLGGTSEARALAQVLVDAGVPVISSLAGRVADPRLPVGEVRVGGFGGIVGLRDWLRDNAVRAVVDATHPYATTITAHAATATSTLGIPLVRIRRPPWIPGEGDRWHSVPSLDAAADAVRHRARRVLLTTGRQDVGVFAGIESAWFLIRVVDPPTADLPPHHQLLTARGPYDFDNELALMRDNAIDTLVTKNSGGPLTRPKLDAARVAGVDVIMVDRPAEPDSGTVVDDVDGAVHWLTMELSRN
ncbi:cobalt-precorrin-6A reductase [Gordonia sinesedis]